MKTGRSLVCGAAVLVSALAGPGLGGAQGPGAADAVPSVVVSTVTTKDVTPRFSFVGRVKAMDTVDLRARVQGVLERRLFQEGAEVEQDALLFVIEKAPYEVVVEQREADLASSRATLTNAQADFNRKEALAKRRTVSQAVLDEARATLTTSRANVLRAEAALREARLDLSYTEIRSPISGKITTAAYSEGNLVGPDSGSLATVTSVDPIHVTIGVTERQLLEARRRGVDLDNPPVAPSLVLSDGSTYGQPGQFDYLAPSVDPNTDTVTARAIFPNPRRILLDGQFVTVIVREKQTVALPTVPQAAVQQDGQGRFVLVVDRDDRVEVRRIVTGGQVGVDWVVEQGLVTGERVIVQGVQKVAPEQKVNPVAATEG